MAAAEIFLNTRKHGTAVDVNARDSAVAASLLLQHGCPIETLRRALTRNADGSASGPLARALDLLALRIRAAGGDSTRPAPPTNAACRCRPSCRGSARQRPAAAMEGGCPEFVETKKVGRRIASAQHAMQPCPQPTATQSCSAL